AMLSLPRMTAIFSRRLMRTRFEMFYTDFGFRAYVPRVSNYILTFSRHFDIYCNSRLVASVDYADICWC
ncbi:hypothetical protein, partial [Paraburkholderia caledonica]|nr:hypothetical protein [Paraburkholderia caledonica]